MASGSYANMENTGGTVWYVSEPGAEAVKYTGDRLFGKALDGATNAEVRMVMASADGSLWFGTSADGVLYIKKPAVRNGKMTVTAELSSETGMWTEKSMNNVYSLDKIGDKIYIGTSAGLAVVDFPEYISRAVTQGMEENDVLSKMVATTTIIDSLDYRSVQLTTSAKDKELAAVGEGASIPETEIKTSDNLTRLHKRGRMLVASYEAIKYQKLDLFTLIMKQLGSHIATSQYVDAVETILYGSTNLMDDKKTPLSYADLVEMWLELSPYKMTTVVAASNEYKTIMNMAEFKDSNAGLNFHATGKLMTPLGADLLKYDDMPEQSILVLDKNAAVEKVQAGGVVTEYDKLIDRQLERASITVTTGFSLMDQNTTLSCRFGG